jgi:hypothetical protein
VRHPRKHTKRAKAHKGAKHVLTEYFPFRALVQKVSSSTVRTIDQNGLLNTRTANRELRLAWTKFAEGFAHIVKRVDLLVTDRFNDVTDIESGFGGSATAFNFRNLRLLRSDKCNVEAEFNHMNSMNKI